MYRLWIASIVTFMTTAAAQAVIIYEPSPVPCPNQGCSRYGNIDPYYQAQLGALHTLSPILSRANGFFPTIGRYGSITPSNCYPSRYQEMDNYYRKADLLPEHMRTAPAAAATKPLEKGAILIIPKKLLQTPTPSKATKA